jgi:hypothetical protein
VQFGPSVGQGTPDWLTDQPPVQAPQAAPAAPAATPDFLTDQPPPERPPLPQVTQPEALGRGIEMGATSGFAPAIHGLEEAGYETMPDRLKTLFGRDRQLYADRAPAVLAKVLTGLGRLGYEHLIGPLLGQQPEQYGTEAYRRGRQAAQTAQEASEEQYPKTYIGGELSGVIAGPKFGMTRGTTVPGRLTATTLGGGAAGGTMGAGEAVSRGEEPGQIAKEVAKGAGTGAALGLAGGAVAETAGAVGTKAANVVRGIINPEREASRRVAGTMLEDVNRRGTAITPEELQAGQAAGVPLTTMDWGHEATRRLARSTANMSPEAANEIANVVVPRFREQARRITGFLDNMFGGLDRGAEREGIEQAARNANRPAYKHAYAIGNNELSSQRILDLAQTDEMQSAMKAAERKWRSRALLDGFGGNFPTEKNLQYWDYVHRELADDARAAARTGRNDEASRLGGLDRTLKQELDTLVPEFAAARRGAYGFFNSENALDAGADFVMRNRDLQGAARALSQMSQSDRELFARGFASNLISKLNDTAFNGDVLNSVFVNNPNSVAAINMALGLTRARQLEALLRVEKVADAARRAMGNSTTAEQLIAAARNMSRATGAGHIAGGAGAVGAFELMKEHDFDWKHMLAGGLLLAGARSGLHKLDEKTAVHIAELLTSQDPGALSRGLQIVNSSRPIFEALRFLTGGGSRVAANELGPVNTAAGAATLLQRIIEGPPAEHSAQQQHQQDLISEQLPSQ